MYEETYIEAAKKRDAVQNVKADICMYVGDICYECSNDNFEEKELCFKLPIYLTL